ncbi:MAG: response regulator [Pseudomonadota bacterium]
MTATQTALPPVRALRVLLLDDDAFTLDIVHAMLGQLGQTNVRAESDARRALAHLGACLPDLLICDLSMPEMDGIEFLQAAAGAGFRGAVLLLSGMDAGVRRAAERLARAQGLQVLGAYMKPLSQDDLRAAIHTLSATLPD